jgi:DNA-binding winged helix-turn-helix (wHTH) protein
MTAAPGATRSNRKPARIVRFGAFEADLDARELRKSGARLKLQHKPFQLLEMLLEARGALVTRKEISERLWPGLYVNFERSLNTAVNSLRRVLRDSPRSPRFIETRAGLGYRFLAPVEFIESRPAPAHQPVSVATNAAPSAARDDYLRGQYFYNQMSEDALRRSIALFQSAIDADPEYAPAHAGLAAAYILHAFIGRVASADALRYAAECSHRALQLDPDLAEAHAALAGVRKLRDGDAVGAEAGYLHAIGLDPGCVPARRGYAALMAASGRFEEAVTELRTARQLDPLSLVTNTELAWALYVARDYQGAVDQSWNTLMIDAKLAPAQTMLALAYEQLGDYDAAAIEFENACKCSDRHPAALAGLAHALAAAGRVEEARAIASELKTSAGRVYISPYWLAVAAAGLGQDEAALNYLDKAVRQGDVWAVWLGADPRFDRLRRDARLDAIRNS